MRYALLVLSAFILTACATQAQMQAQAIDNTVGLAMSQFQACTNPIASSSDFDPLRTRTPLDARNATLEQLAQSNKITPTERVALLKNYTKLQTCRQMLIAQLQPTVPNVVPILAAAYTKNDILLVQLLEGRISWGQELQLAKQLSDETNLQLAAEFQRINAGLQQSHEAELQRRQAAANALAAYAQQQQIINNMNRARVTNCTALGNSVNCVTQ